MSVDTSTLAEAPWRAGLHSARATLRPGLVLIAAAVAVVVAYHHHHAGTHAALDALAEFRMRGGYAFSATAMMLFGGVLPYFYLRRERSEPPPWSHLAVLAAFWAYKGVEIDFLYRTLAAWFGSGTDWPVVGRKMLVDQLAYNPLFAAPYGLVFYAWKDAGFRWAPAWADLRAGRWYYRRVLPVMIAVWAVWVPGTCCIYALPLPLQVPVNSLMNCFWVILFSHLTARQNRAA